MPTLQDNQRDGTGREFKSITIGDLLRKMERAGGDVIATAAAPGDHRGRDVADSEVTAVAIVARGDAARQLLAYLRAL